MHVFSKRSINDLMFSQIKFVTDICDGNFSGKLNIFRAKKTEAHTHKMLLFVLRLGIKWAAWEAQKYTQQYTSSKVQTLWHTHTHTHTHTHVYNIGVS